jgi:hypothetical protein
MAVSVYRCAEFVAARLDEDEAAAMAAAKPDPEEKMSLVGHAHWVARYGTVVDADDDDFAMMYSSVTNSTAEVCAHIARHDPARALREVEAMRRLLRLAESGCPDDCLDHGPETHATEERWGAAIRSALAAIWHDHPGYGSWDRQAVDASTPQP